MILYHAGKEKVEFPEVRKMKYTKDFSWGFYCTNNYEQAVRWAGRGEGEPNRLSIIMITSLMKNYLF